MSKLSYKDKAEYEANYIERFNSYLTVKLPIEIKGNQAFFVPVPEIQDAIIKIYKWDKGIGIVSRSLPTAALKQFASRSLVDEIMLTNNIESVHSTRKEIMDTLDDLKNNNKRNRFYGLVNKYKMLVNDKIVFEKCEDIRKIYDELVLDEVMHEDAGNYPDGEIFRKSSVCVSTDTQTEIHRGLYPETQIIESMKAALSILNNDKIQLLIRISIFHYLFGYIHPFYEGNGRTSRFISSYLLSTEYEPLIGYRISYTIKENINKYYKAFKLCNDEKNRGDLTPFVIMFLEIMETSFSQLYDALKKRHQKWEYYVKHIGLLAKENDKKKWQICNLLIQAGLFSELGIAMNEIILYGEVSRATAKKKIDELAAEDLVVVKKRGNSQHFSINLEKFDSMIG